MSRNRRRLFVSATARGGVWLMAAIALLPLALVLLHTVTNGLPAALSVNFYTHVERPVGIPGSGVSHALTGTLVMVGIASLLAIPVGVLGGIHLVEYGGGQLPRGIRLAADVLVGTPSIAVGLFIYAIAVAPFHHFSALSGAIALAVLMLPIVLRTTESAIALVPNGIREAGLALGLSQWRVALQLILPAAAPGVLTGCLLAVARAAGETAPLIFTAFGNRFYTLDPTQQMSALPLIVYHDALTPYEDLVRQAWGAALLLVALTLFTNVLSRLALRRQIALAGGQ